MKNLLLVFFCLAITYNSFSQVKLKPPVSNIYDLSLKEFLQGLNKAAKEKDKAFIIKSLSPGITNSFGGSGGIDEFKEYWNWDSDDSEFWGLLNKILDLGGSGYDGSGFYSMPYVFTDWPENGNYDAFIHVLVTGTRVNVRDKPDLKNSTVLGQFNHDIVKVDYEKSYPPFDSPKIEGVTYVGSMLWYYVESLDSKVKGYVFWNYIWSPIGYRMGFNKINGEWKITFFAAGD